MFPCVTWEKYEKVMAGMSSIVGLLCQIWFGCKLQQQQLHVVIIKMDIKQVIVVAWPQVNLNQSGLSSRIFLLYGDPFLELHYAIISFSFLR